MKYRKKPVVVEAIQYTKDNLLDVMEFCDGGKKTIFDRYLYIVTLEGNMRVRKGDYIIRAFMMNIILVNLIYLKKPMKKLLI